MTQPGFRKSRSSTPRTRGPEDDGGGFIGSALFSQAQILHLMKSEFAKARRYQIPIACVLLQVDRLAQLVDMHGADLRRVVRQTLMDVVKERTRTSDLMGLMGDDRYLLLLPHTELNSARLVADRIRARFQDAEITVDGKSLGLTLSLGVASCEEQKTMFFDSLVAQAEFALDHAARGSGNRTVSFAEAQLLSGGSPDTEPRSS